MGWGIISVDRLEEVFTLLTQFGVRQNDGGVMRKVFNL